MLYSSTPQKHIIFFIVILAISSLFGCKDDSGHSEFINNVSYQVDQACSDLMAIYTHNMETIDKYLRPDTIALISKNDFYRNMRNFGEASLASVQYFNLLSSLYSTGKNKEQVRNIRDEYLGMLNKLNAFYKTHREFKDFQPGDLDTLYSYYNSLASKAEQLRNIKIEP
ncbi:MAG: hypothetical protein CMN32_11480 [Saprospirales bacterium]|nr:hypothetical protein [Saprospirales bacterium]